MDQECSALSTGEENKRAHQLILLEASQQDSNKSFIRSVMMTQPYRKKLISSQKINYSGFLWAQMNWDTKWNISTFKMNKVQKAPKK